jgi:tetratricopeptide (TPR) repeat protein
MFSVAGRATFPGQLPSITYALLGALLLGSLVSARAQGGGGTDLMGTGGRHTIQGRIYFPSGRVSDLRAKVKLENPSSGGLSVLADLDGAFKFSNLSAGSYSIIIEAGDDYEIARESVYIEGNSSLGRGMRMPSAPRTVMVPIYLQLKQTVKTGIRPGVIDAALAGVPKAAVDLYLSALEAARAGDNKKAVEQLKNAISRYPEFSLAINELGVQYLKLNQADKAAAVLEQAVRLAPDAVPPRLNYGIALLQKRKFAESESELRQVLRRNDGAATAHLYLGINLIHLRNYVEAEKELQRALSLSTNELHLAHYYLGGIYWGKKEYQRAADELEKYLREGPKAPDAERVRATIKELRAKQTSPTSH